MEVKLAIDAIVRQTTVLIAQLATSAGARAPLAHIANQTFLSLTRELESETERGRTLWQALHDFLQEKQVVSRADVLARFSRDDQASIRGILSDMVDAGLVYKAGRQDGTVYRVASPDEIARAASSEATFEALAWVTIYREGPIGEAEIARRLGIDAGAVRDALAALVADQRILAETCGDAVVYRSERCFIPLGQSAGWEAALLDHYQAVVRAICAKLDRGASRAQPADPHIGVQSGTNAAAADRSRHVLLRPDGHVRVRVAHVE